MVANVHHVFDRVPHSRLAVAGRLAALVAGAQGRKLREALLAAVRENILSFAPEVADQTPSLPDARPGSDRFRCAGRESNFLAVILLQLKYKFVTTRPRDIL